MRLHGSVVLLAALAVMGAGADPPLSRPVVVELFTSQGCSTCPPADRLLTELARRDASLVPLAFHVDYWNRAGWSDPFSKSEWSERQARYARKRGATQVFTPQAIVDGGAEVTGSDEARLVAAIAEARARPAATVGLRPALAGGEARLEITVELPPALRGRELDVYAALLETRLATPVGRGENGGRTLENDHVVRALVRVARLGKADARGAYTSVIRIEPSWARPNLGAAAFVQDARSLEVVGAARASI